MREPEEATPPAEVEPRWLDDAEMAAWQQLLRIVMRLPVTIDRQLRRDAGLTHATFAILANLSGAPGERMRMSELAHETATSPSRLSHACALLADRGWIARHPSPEDGRGQIAELTAEGRAVLARVAPGHVAEVRRSVLDPLEPHEVEQLGALLAKIAGPLERPPAPPVPAPPTAAAAATA